MVPAYEGKEAYIFVSYAHKDSLRVLPIIEELYNRKYRVWYDEGIAPGSEWPQNIADHLNAASAVLIFVSGNSLVSPNCENEVQRAFASDKLLIEYKLDGSEHTLLSSRCKDGSCTTIENEEDLIKAIPEKYIGDGSGYERKIALKKSGALLTLMLVLAGILIIAVIAGLLGLKNGVFDAYLPGLNTDKSIRTESKILREQQEIAKGLDDGLIAQAVLMQTDKNKLSEKLTFDNAKVKAGIISNFGFEQLNHEPTYMDLTKVLNDSAWFDYATDKTLEYLTYLPNLKEVLIENGDIKSLEILKECPALEIVRLRKTVFPVEIPKNVGFRVVLQQ